jgi:biopolymer transport protein ExbD
MRSTRSIRNRGRRGKNEPFELDITSLLDILVILLVFLLKSYNSSGVSHNIPSEVQLPNSASISLSSPGTRIQVSPDMIWVDDKLVVDLKKAPRRMYDHKGKRIIPLYNELTRIRSMISQVAKSTGAKKFSGNAQLIIDKSLKYSYLKKLMYTCATAGYKEYKFVVRGTEE